MPKEKGPLLVDTRVQNLGVGAYALAILFHVILTFASLAVVIYFLVATLAFQTLCFFLLLISLYLLMLEQTL